MTMALINNYQRGTLPMTHEPEPLELVPAGDAHLTPAGPAREALISLVMHAVDSPNTQRNYRIALDEFLDWWDAAARPVLTKAVVQEYKTVLQGRGLAPSTINLKLSALRKLVAEAADNGLIDPVHANGIQAVKGAKTEGHRSGNWLTKAQALLNAPDPTTTKGLRELASPGRRCCTLGKGGGRPRDSFRKWGCSTKSAPVLCTAMSFDEPRPLG